MTVTCGHCTPWHAFAKTRTSANPLLRAVHFRGDLPGATRRRNRDSQSGSAHGVPGVAKSRRLGRAEKRPRNRQIAVLVPALRHTGQSRCGSALPVPAGNRRSPGPGNCLPSGAWRFAGEASAIQRNGPSHYELRHFGIKPFFTITSDRSQNGVAVQQVLQNWFDLTQPGFAPVFSITLRGSESRFGFGVGRTIEAAPALAESRGIETFQVALSIRFKGPGLNEPASYTGVYERRDGAPKFALRDAYSETPHRAPMPKEDFAELADPFSGISNEKLLSYALPGLKKIANGPDGDAKEWLRSILRNTNDTVPKRLLTDLLRGR